MESNPLYHLQSVPDFATLKPEHADAVLKIIEENRAELEEILKERCFSWQNLVLPLQRMSNRLHLAFTPIAHLKSVLSTEAWRGAYEKLLPELSAYENDLALNPKLYQAYQSLLNGCEFYEYNAAEKKHISDSIRDFELGGVNLPEDKKEQFKKNNLRLSELSTQFSNQVLDATNAWSLHLEDEKRLVGLPETALKLLKSLAEKEGQSGYRLTLDAPAVLPILTYADDRDLRAEVHRAFSSRASELDADGKFNNADLIREIMALRHEQAQILGFPDTASMTVKTRMTERPEVVFQFLNDLVAHSKKVGEKEMQDLRDFAAKELNLQDLKAHDVAYVAEKLRQARYDFSQEALRPYFPIEQALSGMFQLCKRLFDIDFRSNNNMSVWHEDVRAFDVLQNDQVIAHFYFDLYARPQKQGGAWMNGAVSRFRDGEHLQLPVAYLVCNFTPAVGDKPACLSHDELTTMLHEFGHGLHHMLTQVDVLSQAGINGVEWDAVEQPSQFLENFAFEWEALQAFAKHVDTGEALPRDLFDKLLAAKNFQSAMAMLRQLEFALFDFSFHSGSAYQEDVLKRLAAVREQVTVVPVADYDRFPMRFTHIFAGGYAAGYYSYKWAEVLSADSFSAFEEEGLFNPETGKRFRDEILAVGSSRSSMESFIAFRGREPKVEALLRHSGLM